MADFVEICNVYVEKMIIKAAMRIFNSDKICSSYIDLNFGVTFLEHSVNVYFLDRLSTSKCLPRNLQHAAQSLSHNKTQYVIQTPLGGVCYTDTPRGCSPPDFR